MDLKKNKNVRNSKAWKNNKFSTLCVFLSYLFRPKKYLNRELYTFPDI